MIILTLILLTSCILLFSFPVSASAPSDLDLTQIEIIQQFLMDLPDFQLQSYGYEYGNITYSDILETYYGSTGVLIGTGINYEITNVSDTVWQPSQDFYNPDTGAVIDRDNLVFVHFSDDVSEGYFVYDKVSGLILKTGEDFAHSQLSLIGYGNEYFNNTVDDLRQFVDENGYCAWFNPNSVSQDTIDYLDSYGDNSCWGIIDYMSGSHHVECGYFCPDVNMTNLFYVREKFGRSLPQIFMTDEGYALFSWYNNNDWTINDFPPYRETNVINGVTYTWRFPRSSNYNPSVVSDHVVYTSTTEDIDDAIFFVPTEGYDIPDIISSEAISDNPVTYSYAFNPSYDDDATTSVTNYPMTATREGEASYDLPYDYVGELDYAINSPALDDSLGGSLIVGDLNDNIPILSNLKNRFPFSIPWDIAEMVRGLNVQRQTPAFNWDIYIPILDYTWHVEFDLSAFNGVASLFRGCFLITFIIGLAIFSYKQHFGS